MATQINIDTSEMRQFFEKLGGAKEDFQKEMQQWLEALGNDFLTTVQEEIIRRQVMDTRLLLVSFQKGAEGNVWSMTDGGLTLEVGTNVKYADWVENGHRQQPGRFVPGHWSGDRFIYTPGASEGMVLKSSWVEGKHYFESAVRIIEVMMPDYMEAKMNQWLAKYF
ncbi:MAG: HK97 gp10 family phage protein [Clostridiales bacterium]|nr:HK97 gp10 family phage protein [Clostridiales bacterium]